MAIWGKKFEIIKATFKKYIKCTNGDWLIKWLIKVILSKSKIILLFI